MLTTALKSYRWLFLDTCRFPCSYAKTVSSAKPRGKLLVIPTPIGNLEDLSPNIVKALYRSDLIGCEDRRVAGQLYHLIRGRKIVAEMEERFGSLGLTSLIEADPEEVRVEEKAHQFYNYANMKDRQRRKFLRRMTQEEQNRFRVEFLKYRAKKVLNKNNEWVYPSTVDRIDQLYGIDLSDMKYIETQIMNCRQKKGRGVLIPLNTYNETKMFDLVRALLESKVVAVVSDAGMPCISDPGWKLVNKVRSTMPDAQIEVVGGPSSVGILALQASVCARGESLSGRFQGFSSLSTGNFDQKNRQMQNIKMKEFSIHFINANKLKARLLQLEKTFGGEQRIILNNELTKKYERRFEGTIAELIDKMDQPQFKPVGEISYLLYPAQLPQTNESMSASSPLEDKQQSEEEVELTETLSLEIPKFLQALQRHHKMAGKEKVRLLCDLFSIKPGEARQHVYKKYDKSQD